MNEEVFNIEVRKFLKHFGVTAQREIEHAVRDALEAGKLSPSAVVPVRATLEIGELGQHVIEGELHLQ